MYISRSVLKKPMKGWVAGSAECFSSVCYAAFHIRSSPLDLDMRR